MRPRIADNACSGRADSHAVACTLLANVKPVPDWADKALTAQYRQLYFCKKKSDTLGANNAERAVARLRRRFALG